MKRIIYSISIVIASLSMMTGCDQSRLEEPQKGKVADEFFYKTEEDCTQATAAIYASLLHYNKTWYNDLIMGLYLGDEVYKGSSGYKLDDAHFLMIYSEEPSHKYVLNEFQNMYRLVYLANLVIDHFSDSNSAYVQQCVAEAKVLKSLAYIKLISFWGNPPIIKSTLDDIYTGNSDPAEAWAYVIQTLDEAITSGKLVSKSTPESKVARVTKEFALALKGKAQVFSGDYLGAKSTLKEVISSNKYSLIPGDRLGEMIFSSKGNLNSESLFQANTLPTESTANKVTAWDQFMVYCPPRNDKHKVVAGSYITTYQAAWGHFTPTEKFARAIIKNEGLYSNRVKAWFYTYELAQENGVIEFSSYRSSKNKKVLESTTPGVPSTSVPVSTNNDVAAENVGFWNNKLTMGPEEIIGTKYDGDKVNRPYMRYAEVLLLYAEACAMTNDDDGLMYLNLIAERAGAPTYDTLTMANVKQEKWFEMWCEGCRFVDLVRWGDAEKELSDHYTALPVFFGYQVGKSAKDISPDGRNILDEVYEIRHYDLKGATGGQYALKFLKGRDEYLPYPATEIANNRNLVQNPGY